MAACIKPLVGPRRLQWNGGGWFGSSLGSSAWMMLASGFLVVHSQPALALAPAVGFATVLFASLFLWKRRDRIYPFTAIMTLFGLLAIVMPIIWTVISTYASDAAIAGMNWQKSSWAKFLVSAIMPVLILWFLFLERSTPSNGTPRSNTTNVA